MTVNPFAAIHARKRSLGLDDDTYRDLLERVTGKRSAKDLTPRERSRVIAVMDRQGAAPKPKAKKLEGRFVPILRALWIAGWNLGLVHDRRDSAMLSWINRQTGIQHTRFLVDPADARKAVESLKKWIARSGVDWGHKSVNHHWLLDDDRWRIINAQWAILVKADAIPAAALATYVRDLTGKDKLSELSDPEWHGIMNGLGVLVRGCGPFR